MSDPTYWEGCFPKYLMFPFGYEDAQLWAASHMEERAPRAEKCVIEFKHVPSGNHGKLRRTLQAAVETDGGSWNTGDFNFIARLWEKEKKGAPAAFMTFSVAVTERTRSGRIDWVRFEPDLAYVFKAKRKRGLGTILAAAFEPWLWKCKVVGQRVKRGGVHVLFFAEYHSKGGGWIGQILHDHFKYLMESKSDVSRRNAGWDIRETEYDAGF